MQSRSLTFVSIYLMIHLFQFNNELVNCCWYILLHLTNRSFGNFVCRLKIFKRAPALLSVIYTRNALIGLNDSHKSRDIENLHGDNRLHAWTLISCTSIEISLYLSFLSETWSGLRRDQFLAIQLNHFLHYTKYFFNFFFSLCSSSEIFWSWENHQKINAMYIIGWPKKKGGELVVHSNWCKLMMNSTFWKVN